jgi:hypothetical protein
MGAVGISYKFIAETYNTFTVTGVPAGDVVFQVYIDGEATKLYTVQGNVVTVTDPLLNVNSQVRVLVSKREKA